MLIVPENEGHEYSVQNFDNKSVFTTISFIKKEPVSEGSTEMKVVQDGTTNEELIEVLIHRCNFLGSKFPSRENSLAITKLEEALMWLNKRTADRIKRGVEGTHQK